MHNRKALGIALLAAGGLALVGLLVPAAAQTKGKTKGKNPPAAINPQGEPPQFHKGTLTGYALWHSKKGWHLRTTTRNREHRFHGTITVEGGHFVHVHPHDLEKGGKLADHWRVHAKRHELTFDFKTDKGIDGIDFLATKEAHHIRFRLHFNGKHQREHIFIGHNGAHPHTDPFTLIAHPHKKK